MITIQHQTTRLTVTEANAPMYRALIDSGKPPKLHREKGASHKRAYPEFKPGMSASDYAAAFTRFNDNIKLVPLQHECANFYKPATMLDATIPECIEEENHDFVAPVAQDKPKRASLAALRVAILECLPDLKHYAATHGPGPDARLAALLKVLEK